MEAGIQTSLSEEEKEACHNEDYDNATFKPLENIKIQNPEAHLDTIIESLSKHFAMENRDKRSGKQNS